MKTQKLVVEDLFGEAEQAVSILVLSAHPVLAGGHPHPKQLALKRIAAKTAIIQHHETKN